MSGETGCEGRLRPSRARAQVAVATVGFALCCLALATALAAGAAAQEDGGEPPEFGNATKGNLTTIELTITDDVDVDESSISASDFRLSAGSVDGVAVNETGNDTVVDVRLTSVVSSNEVTVSLADGESIADVDGNRLTDARATVTGMDGFRPQLQEFEISRINESAATVRVVSSEELSELYVGVGGPGTEALTMENFTERSTPASFEVPYEATVRFPREGEYDLLVGTMVDDNDVTSRYNVEKTVIVDRTPPSAAVGGPASAEVGEPVTFSGESSEDEFGIADYEWTVDGNATGSGPTLEHAFETPGYHGVTLTVRDRRNNTDSRTVPVLVEADATVTDVAIDATNATAATVAVGPNRTTGRVSISRNGTLVATPTVRLDSLTVDVPVNASADLDLSARANATDWFGGNATVLSGFAVGHDRDLATATFRFSVNRSRLSAADLAPGEVTLYREAEDWRPVYTTKIDEGEGWITYEATAAGLSRFVVGAAGGGTDSEGDGDDATDGSESAVEGPDAREPVGSPRIRVANSSLLTAAVEPGGRAVVDATLHNDGDAAGDFVAGLVVNNSVVTTRTVTVPAGENRTVTFAERVEAGGSVVVNGTLAGSLTVGGNGSAATAGSGGLAIPDPIALWPGGLVGRLLGAVFWFLVVLYVVLKSLAVYLGY